MEVYCWGLSACWVVLMFFAWVISFFRVVLYMVSGVVVKGRYVYRGEVEGLRVEILVKKRNLTCSTSS